MQQQTMKYRDWLNLNAHLLWCYDHTVTSPPREEKRERYLFMNNGAWLVHQGWAQVKHDGKVFKATPGQWLVVKPSERFQYFAPGTVMLSVAFDAHWPDGTKWLEDGLSVVFDAADYPLLEERARPMVQIMEQMGITPGVWDMRDRRVAVSDFFNLERYLDHWLNELVRALADHDIYPSGTSTVDERVARAIQLMNSSLTSESLDMHQLAQQIGVSQVHLTRLFQQEMNESPKRYLEKLRVEYARQRLNVPGVKINEVGSALGFAYVSNFSKWFKKHTGLSPKAYVGRKGKSLSSLL